jgi:hypothetical protein
MYVVLEPVTGSPKAYLDRAKLEIERVLGFRGSVSDAKVKGNTIIIEFELNPKWDSTESEKVSYIKEWVTAKVRKVFVVVGVFEKS